MKKKERAERLFAAIGDTSDRYIDEAAGRKSRSTVIRRWVALAACFAIVVSLSLYLFIPINDAPNIAAYEGSEYYPVISRMANYYYRPSNNKNNFEKLLARLENMLPTKSDMDGSMVPEYGANFAPGDQSSDNYFEVTDNQVAGVIEADLIKASEAYLYRVSYERNLLLRIYGISDGTEGTEPIASLEITKPEGAHDLRVDTAEMYLSSDLTTVTVICTYYDVHQRYSTAVYTVNVENPAAPTVTGTVTLSGSYNTSRKIGDKILVITDYSAQRGEIDYGKPETYIPAVNSGEGSELIPMEDIVMPSVTTGIGYSVLMLLDEGGTEPTSTLALFNYTNAVYVTENEVFAAQNYFDRPDEGSGMSRDMTEIAHIGIEDGLTLKGKMTAEGNVKDQYSLDEKDGYLRLVTTTNLREKNGVMTRVTNAALYVFDLSTHSERTSVKYFAPDREGVESVRFDGDKLYVCTAERITVTDPVYFFDLSDYDKISSTDTGTIDGYSTSLIQLGNGYLLGVGVDKNFDGKLEIYREEGGSVVSTDSLVFGGDYSTVYKSYLINRELGIFGLHVRNLNIEDAEGKTQYYGDTYLILSLNDGEIEVLATVDCGGIPARTRAFVKNGIVYISTDTELLKWAIE